MQKKYFGVNLKKVKELGIQKIGKIEELMFSKTNVKYVVAEKHLLYSIFPTPKNTTNMRELLPENIPNLFENHIPVDLSQ